MDLSKVDRKTKVGGFLLLAAVYIFCTRTMLGTRRIGLTVTRPLQETSKMAT